MRVKTQVSAVASATSNSTLCRHLLQCAVAWLVRDALKWCDGGVAAWRGARKAGCECSVLQGGSSTAMQAYYKADSAATTEQLCCKHIARDRWWCCCKEPARL
jgi:hypothetical protein